MIVILVFIFQRAKDVVEDAYVNQMRHVVLIPLVITPSKAEEADKVKEDRMKMVEVWQ